MKYFFAQSSITQFLPIRNKEKLQNRL